MISKIAKENAYKVAFLSHAYPEHTLNQIINMLELPPLFINTALWAAQELKLIGTPDPNTGQFERLPPPEQYMWGEYQEQLQETLLYAFQQLAKKEADLEEMFFVQWTSEVPGHDVIVAMKWLMFQEKLAEYTINDQQIDAEGHKVFEDDENTPVMDAYIFYCLFENKDKKWGQKSFKVNPITGEPNTEESAEDQ